MMGGIVGIFMIGCGIIWTVLAAQASPFFALFGVFWTGIAVVMTVYHFKNATKKNRYSAFDITDSQEEPDPLNERFGNLPTEEKTEEGAKGENRFCPYCGTSVGETFTYCNHCGKKLP